MNAVAAVNAVSDQYDSSPIVEAATAKLLAILERCMGAGCSDVHVRAERPAFARASGRLFPVDVTPPSAAEVAAMITVTARRALREDGMGAFEYSFERPGVSRFRAHAYREARGWALTLRAVPLAVPDFAALRLPPVVKQLCAPSPGLVLIAGPTGSGKTTTAASMLSYIAANEAVNIVTIEDPVEYVLDGPRACVSQREVGRDTPTFVDGVREAMREDPDVLFVGEVRDADSLEAALTAADTGHAVIATYHTRTCVHTFHRLVKSFPPEEQDTVRERVADALRGVLCQRLLPHVSGHGRVLATEVLVNTFSMQEHIRDAAKTRAITKLLERSGDQNMHALDQSLYALVSSGLVDMRAALGHAQSPNDLRHRLELTR